jgi:hypothetical protein
MDMTATIRMTREGDWFVDIKLAGRTTTIERKYESAQEAETDVLRRFPEPSFSVELVIDATSAFTR